MHGNCISLFFPQAALFMFLQASVSRWLQSCKVVCAESLLITLSMEDPSTNLLAGLLLLWTILTLEQELHYCLICFGYKTLSLNIWYDSRAFNLLKCRICEHVMIQKNFIMFVLCCPFLSLSFWVVRPTYCSSHGHANKWMTLPESQVISFDRICFIGYQFCL